MLYMIGNGFDLWHGIPSHYWQFKEFLRKQHPDVMGAVEDYLLVEDDWSDLELALASIDVDGLIEDLGHFMTSYSADDWSDSGHGDFQYEVERVVERLSVELQRCFGEWVRQLLIPTPATAQQLLRTIDSTAHFFTFNYTSTLHGMYGVPDANVLYIHGRADFPNDKLVLGHAWSRLDRRSLNDRDDIEEIDTRLMEAHVILDEYFITTFKPSARLIQEHQPFFKRMVNIQDVCVLGHSLSQVDAPYFSALLATPGVTDARWQVAYRPDEDDPDCKRQQLAQLGVRTDRISLVPWSDI